MQLVDTLTTNRKDIQDTFYQFINLLVRNEKDNLKGFLHPDITLIDNGSKQIIKGIDDAVSKLDGFPGSSDSEYRINALTINEISNENSYISASVSLGSRFVLLTLILKLFKGSWRIVHLHCSFTGLPDKVSGDDSTDVNDRLTNLTMTIKRLEEAASLDYLTGLYNRYKFNQILVEEFDNAAANNTPLSIIFADIDNFKQINDKYGHLIGDQVIVRISEIIRRNLLPKSISARWGGDEFVILTPGVGIPEVLDFADNLRKLIEKCDNVSHTSLTASFGVAQYHKGDTIDIFLNKADLALYKAKRKGKNRVET